MLALPFNAPLAARTRPVLPAVRLLLGIAALAVPAAAQQLTWMRGAAAGQLEIRTASAAAPGSTERVVRSGVRMVDLEITNRTQQRGQRGDVSRRVRRGGGHAFVELPGGGSLHGYVRAGGRWHGLLWIDAAGAPQVVDERQGVGVGGVESPYLDRVGVAYDGRHVVLPLLNDGFILGRLDGRAWSSTGSIARLVSTGGELEPTTICPGRAVLICGREDDRILRLRYDEGAPLEDLTPAVSGSEVRLKSEFAPSFDGRRVVALYGPRRSYGLYLLGESGAARRLPPPSAKYEEPGYLPDTVNGPRLLLSDDGSELLYVDATVRDEAFVLDVETAATSHVTGDHNFQPYIGIIVLPYVVEGTFLSGIGDAGLFDVYAATPTRSSVTNLTLTNNAATAPWDSGNLVPRTISAATDGSMLLEVVPSAGGSGGLFRLGSNGTSLLAIGTRGALTAGACFSGRADLSVDTVQGQRIFAIDSLRTCFTVPDGVRMSPAVRAADSSYRAALVALQGARALVLTTDPGRRLDVIPVGSDSRALTLTHAGALVVEGSRLQMFAGSAPVTLDAGATVLEMLSGRRVAL